MNAIKLMTVEHWGLVGLACALAGVNAFQVAEGHPLVVGGVAVASVLATLRAVFSAVPGAK